MSDIDSIIRSLSTLTPKMKRELVDRLSAENLGEVSAAAAETAKKTRLGRIAAARDSRNEDFMLAQGILSRAALNVEDVTDARTFDRLCAASARPPSALDKSVVKSALFRLGIMAD
jgi:hypothetical protein